MCVFQDLFVLQYMKGTKYFGGPDFQKVFLIFSLNKLDLFV